MLPLLVRKERSFFSGVPKLVESRKQWKPESRGQGGGSRDALNNNKVLFSHTIVRISNSNSRGSDNGNKTYDTVLGWIFDQLIVRTTLLKVACSSYISVKSWNR